MLKALACGAGLTALWSLAALLIVPGLITSAYHQRSFWFLNRIIAGRDVHPVETYLQLWQRIALDVVWICVAITIVAAAAEFWQQRRGQAKRDVSVDMPRRRFLMANAVIVALLVSFLAVHLGVRWGIASHEPWPLSTFSMYSGIAGDPVPYFRLCLITAGPDSKRHFLDGAALYPFDRSRIIAVFRAVSHDPSRLEKLLEHLRLRYNSSVESGDLVGPLARCVEIYTVDLPLRDPVVDPLENLPPTPLSSSCDPSAP